MALSNPVTTAQFIDLFFVKDWRLLPNDRSQISGRESGGTILTNRRAPTAWSLTAVTQDLTKDQSMVLRSRVAHLGMDLCFLAYDKGFQYPSLDPDGTIWAGASSPQISAIADRRTISFSGLPANYEIADGTVFGVLWDTDRRWLGHVIGDETADAGGDISGASVSPALPDSVVTGSVVNFVRPVAKFKMTEKPSLSWSSGRTSVYTLKAESTYEKTA